ncbi:serine/arginine repetitive matrix protein 2-like [Patella vulgata]|uniref:serine/arginine repetitive matrix protein 2-like n=1 Tax=Patella vulgata TaxID=6465 RepID=UPI0024A8F977|nr:serine/arginine repetitive matrix protein 2-like [Patella vulgata]
MWRQKDIMEKGRLEKRLKSYEREVMRYAHIIDREKRAIIRDFEAVRRTSGNSDLAIPPNGQRDNIYAESSYSKSGFRLSEKRLMEWKLSEKELERFLKRTQVGKNMFPRDTSYDNRRPKTSMGRNSKTNNGFINGRRPKTGVLTLTGQYPEIQSQAKIFRLYLNNDGIESKLEYQNKDEKTLRLDKSHFIKIPANGYIKEEACDDLNDEVVATTEEQPVSDDDKVERSLSRRSMKSACCPGRRSRCRSRVDLVQESKEVNFPRSRRLSRSSNSPKTKGDRAASITRIYSSPSRRSSLDSPRTPPKRRNGSISRKCSQSMDARRSSSSLKRVDSFSRRSSTTRNPISNSDENLSNKAASKQNDLGNKQDFTENKDSLSNQNPESENLQECGESQSLLKSSELSSFGEMGQFNSSNAADLENSDQRAENPQKPRRVLGNNNIRSKRSESIQTRKRLGRNPQSIRSKTNTPSGNSRRGYVESVINSNKNGTIMESPRTSSRYSPPAIGIYQGKSGDPGSSHQPITSEEPVFFSDSEEPQLDLSYPDTNVSRRSSKRHVIRKARFNLHNKARKGGLIGSKSNEPRIIPSVKRGEGRGSAGGSIKPSQHNSRNFDSNDRNSKPSIPSTSVTMMNASTSSTGCVIRRSTSSSAASSHPRPPISSAASGSTVASTTDVSRPHTSSTIGTRRSPASTTPIAKRPSTSSNSDTTRPPTSSDHNTMRPSTSPNRNTTRPSTSSDLNATRPPTSTRHNSTRPSTSSDLNATRTSTSSRHNTTRPSTSAIRDFVVDQLASLGDGNIRPLTSSPSDQSRPTTSSTRQRKWNSDVCIDYPPAIHAKNNINSVFKVAMVFSKSARKTRLNKLVDEFSPDLRQMVREERLTELKSRSSQLSNLASQFNIE